MFLLLKFQFIFAFLPAIYAVKYRCPPYAQTRACDCQNGVSGLEIYCEKASPDDVRKALETVGHTRQPIEALTLVDIRLPTLLSNLLRVQDVDSISLKNCSTSIVDREAFVEVAAKLKSLLLTGNALEKVPSQALGNLTSLEKLSLDYNRIGALHAEDFKGLHSLLELSLQGNRIKSIHRSAFEGMGCALEKLELGWNELTEFPGLSLCNRSSLKALVLNSNKIASLLIQESDAKFSLEILDLANNLISRLSAGAFGSFQFLVLDISGNVIEFVHPSAFRGTTDSLMFLIISDNRLEEVPSAALRNMSQLGVVLLSGNRICRLRKDDFMQYGKNLMFLNLANNSLSYVESGVFHHLELLTHLGLSSNYLNVLPYETYAPVLDTLEVIDIHDNPLHCDCNLSWLRDWMIENMPDGVESANETKCSTPEEHFNAPLPEIPSKQLLCGNYTLNQTLPCCNCFANNSGSSNVVQSLLRTMSLAITALATHLLCLVFRFGVFETAIE